MQFYWIQDRVKKGTIHHLLATRSRQLWQILHETLHMCPPSTSEIHISTYRIRRKSEQSPKLLRGCVNPGIPLYHNSGARTKKSTNNAIIHAYVQKSKPYLNHKHNHPCDLQPTIAHKFSNVIGYPSK